MLESYLREKLNEKDILLMTHIVLGYPSFEDSFRIIETMVEAYERVYATIFALEASK